MALQAFPRPTDEYDLFKHGIQLGFDGSLVRDNMLVYVLGVCDYGASPVQEIDYFHGLACGIPNGANER